MKDQTQRTLQSDCNGNGKKRDQSNGTAIRRANSESNVLGLLWQRLMQDIQQSDCNAQNLKRRIIK